MSYNTSNPSLSENKFAHDSFLNDTASTSKTSKKQKSSQIRLAWLNPDMKLSFYIQPVLRELFKLFPESVVYTGRWSGYVPGCEDAFKIEVVGKQRTICLRKTKGYSRALQFPSLSIISHLWKQKPQVVFVVGFSLWALIVLFLKPFLRWQTIIVYSGSSPNIDMSDSKLRLWLRRFMAKRTDAFITNSRGGKAYLTTDLAVPQNTVFARPYQVPDKQALLNPVKTNETNLSSLQHPVFLYIGQTIYRKGLSYLLQACAFLEKENCQSYSLVIVGDGSQRTEFEEWSREHELQERVKWVGWGDYGQLGSYYQQSDVFIFPTLEDIWGMVVMEAMLFGKPVLCSKDAGVAEIILENVNGHVFDPQEPKEIAMLMRRFINEPQLVKTMGDFSLKTIQEQDTPEESARKFAEVIASTLKDSE